LVIRFRNNNRILDNLKDIIIIKFEIGDIVAQREDKDNNLDKLNERIAKY